ncbi:MAG: glycosyltransferase family 4 protein [Betaproteobacteria bacterium]|nr:glycosyltransferase family 4 protein [Betaproteobacteria bacterium]
MRILYLHPDSWSGEYALLEHLVARGIEICVLEEKRGFGATRQAIEHFRAPGDGIATLWYDPGRGAERFLTWLADRLFRRAFDGRNLVHRMWVVRAAVAYFRPDVVVCSDGFSYAIPAGLLKRLGLMRPRLVVSYIGGDVLDCPEAEYGRRRTPMVNWLIQKSIPGIDVLRPVSGLLQRVLLGEGADAARMHVIPSHLVAGSDRLADIRACRSELAVAIRKRYGIPDGAPLIVTLSGNQKGKGLHLLAQAWRAVHVAVPECHWLLCGPNDPWLDRAVRPALDASSAAQWVHFTGRLSGADVFEYLAAADLHVNPTLCEGLNMVTVEAAAVGTPSVTSDGAGIAEWVERFGTGLVVPADDAVALGDAVIEAMRDAALRLTWQGRCPNMLGDFSLEHVADQLLRAVLPLPPAES